MSDKSVAFQQVIKDRAPKAYCLMQPEINTNLLLS